MLASVLNFCVSIATKCHFFEGLHLLQSISEQQVGHDARFVLTTSGGGSYVARGHVVGLGLPVLVLARV